MQQRRGGETATARCGWRAPRWWAAAWRVWGSVLVLGAAGASLATAQRGESPAPTLTRAQLRAMATATRTAQAGRHLPDGTPSPDGAVYVPPQCVGTRRCPLIFHSQPSTDWLVPVADKYGFIIGADYNLARYPRDLRAILANFLVDLDKIVVMGNCAGVPVVMAAVAKNLDVFSRAVMMLGPYPWTIGAVDPPNGTTEFYIEYGLRDGNPMITTAHQLQRAGHRVTLVFGVRPHIRQVEAYDLVGQWLAESWASPNPADRPAPATVAEVALTSEALAKMTAFWTRFNRREIDGGHDLIPWLATVERVAHQRMVAVPYPDEDLRPVTRIMDMPVMAAKFATIATLLEKAGLTAQQHDEYRVALFSAYATWREWKGRNVAVLTTSMLGKNVEFIDTHPDEMKALEATGMWETP